MPPCERIYPRLTLSFRTVVVTPLLCAAAAHPSAALVVDPEAGADRDRWRGADGVAAAASGCRPHPAARPSNNKGGAPSGPAGGDAALTLPNAAS